MLKATRQQTKIHNTYLILKTVYDHDGISRAEIARATHLTKTTVSNIVAELMADGLVEETGFGASAAGKPPILLKVVDDARHFIGIDLANSEFHGAILNLRGDLVQRFDLRTNNLKGEAALELVYTLIDKLLAASDKSISGIGIGTPGLMDPENGVIRRSINLDWQDLPLRDLIEERYYLPCYIANDCQAAAMGEYTFVHNNSTSNLVVVKVGQGIGSGIVLNGQLYYGDGYGAGEIGHLVMKDDGELCGCGNYGCLETLASTRAVVEQAKKIAQNNPNSLLHQFATTTDEITTETVLQAFNAGDKDINLLINKAGYYLGSAIANFVGVLNVQNIVIAGSMARFGEAILEPIQCMIQKNSMSILARETKVSFSSLDQEIVIKGAVSLILANELPII